MTNITAKILLNYPICVEIGDKVSLSRRISKQYRLIGYGNILRGVKVELVENVENVEDE